ncbi:tripartite tricarboxylate transporter substrate binding protein [Ideonella azotifigens]|uniref:Tripartite tricarboxylate transporter substrate binding protein n=1 Tax=Ideonella azotifigens TaxID=513160 RepID=A0ABP3VPY8_9BURK|nr:tripartite tricarboxylate transporter substrate binding protein [Ideonella azotifigens]MCD2340656.1 tripartite tricarboxylate transporter substrate binding protein [Ideonella azotifigens]
MNTTRRSVLASAASLAAFGSAFPLRALAADAYPSKPITYTVAFPPGGTSDILARLIADKLGPALKGTVIVENKAGAGGSVGSEIVSHAAPDGYTLLGGTISSHAINVSLYPKLGYDPVKSFVPVTLIGTNPLVLLVKADSPYKTAKDLAAAAKSKPLTAASAGNGTSQHLALELFKYKLGLKDVVHVPYKGSGPALQDTLAGQVDMMFDTTVAAAQFIESGKLRALAVTSAKRVSSLPDVPTIAETVLPGFEVVSWQAIFAPAGTPKPLVDRLNSEIGKILATADMQERLTKLGMLSQPMTSDQIQAFQKAEVTKWAEVIKAANIKVD